MSAGDEPTIINLPKHRIKLERGQKGGYGWEIAVGGDDPDLVLSETKRLDQELRRYVASGPPIE